MPCAVVVLLAPLLAPMADAEESREAGSESVLEKIETWADESRTFGKDSFHAEYQFDTRDFNTLHAMGSGRLPAGLNLWGFVDFEATKGAPGSRGDTSRLFYEIDLRRKVWKDFGLIGEVNDFQGADNVVLRAGLFYMPSFEILKRHSIFLYVKGFPFESDLDGGQLSFAMNKVFTEFLDGRVSAGGFLDINFDSGANDDETNLVTEWQLRVRLLGGLHAITEFRVNEFLSNDQNLGVGFGARYVF